MLQVQVRYWDLTSGEQVQRMEGHADYVRTAAVNPINSNIWATGQCSVWGPMRLSAVFFM